MLRDDELIGAEIIDVGWTTLTVRLVDGRLAEIRIDEGHSGPELTGYLKLGK